MTKSEIKKIEDLLKGHIEHIQKLGDELKKFNDYAFTTVQNIKEVYEKEGKEKAEDLVDIFRKKTYDNAICSTDIQIISGKVIGILDVMDSMGIKIELDDKTQKSIEYIKGEAYSNTELVDGKVEISKNMKFEKVMAENDVYKITPNSAILERILKS